MEKAVAEALGAIEEIQHIIKAGHFKEALKIHWLRRKTPQSGIVYMKAVAIAISEN